jgi:hypothetical protein
MQRDGERDLSIGMLQTDVAAALPYDAPFGPFQGLDEALPRNDRQALAHAGTGNLRRITPASSERPSSRSPST